MKDINLLQNDIHLFGSKTKFFFNIDNLIILSISSIIFFFLYLFI